MSELSLDQEAALEAVFLRARDIGLLGPAPIQDHIDHARRFERGLSLCAPPSRCLDIGSGAGVPGLVLALLWPKAQIFLLDVMVKRCVFLRSAIDELGLSARVTVVEGRAETLARTSALEESMDLVTARAFGGPAVTAECAVRFVRAGGFIAVSEPPGNIDRWPELGLATLGLRRQPSGTNVAVFERFEKLPERFPRRAGIPEKRPLF